jgi:hypothetical protein
MTYIDKCQRDRILMIHLLLASMDDALILCSVNKMDALILCSVFKMNCNDHDE